MYQLPSVPYSVPVAQTLCILKTEAEAIAGPYWVNTHIAATALHATRAHGSKQKDLRSPGEDPATLELDTKSHSSISSPTAEYLKHIPKTQRENFLSFNGLSTLTRACQKGTMLAQLHTKYLKIDQKKGLPTYIHKKSLKNKIFYNWVHLVILLQ